MEIGVKEAARLLDVSEKTIYRWVHHGGMPGFRIHAQYRFNRAELLEWATSQRLNVSVDIFSDPENRRFPPPSLEEALKTGGIHYRISGHDKASALESTIDVMPLPEEVDKHLLLRVLLARETLGSTGIGDGIAIPHVRNPIVMHIPRPMISLCFLECPVDFNALDGQRVHTLFTIVSPVISAHLSLLSKLSFALRQVAFGDAIKRQGTREEIYACTRQVDAAIAARLSAISTEGTT